MIVLMPEYNIFIETISVHYRKILVFGLIFGYLVAYLLNLIRPSLILTSLIITVPIVITIIIIPKFRYDENISLSIYIHQKIQQYPKIHLILFVVVYTISIFFLYLFNYRPTLYFILICGLFTLVFLQIVSDNISRITVLFEILLLILNMTYGITLKYPLYFGMIDIFDHIAFSNFVYQFGMIIPTDYGWTYANFPLLHILTAISASIINLNIQIAYFLICGLIFLIAILFLYTIVNFLFRNQQISLLSCLFFCASTEVIFYSAYFVARVLAFIGFLILFFCLIKLSRCRDDFRFLLLANLIAVFILLVHQVSIMQIIFLLTIFATIFYLAHPLQKHPVYFYLYFIFIFITYWFYSAWDFLKELIQSRINPDFWQGISDPTDFSKVQATQSNWLIDSLSWIINNFYVAFFLLFALIGIGVLLKNKKSKYAIIFGFFSFICIWYYIPTPLVNVWQYVRLLGFYRIALLVSPFMALVMAFGVFSILQKYRNTPLEKKIFCFILAILFIFFFSSLTTALNARDCPDLWPDYWNPYFKTSELDSIHFIESYSHSGEHIVSDDIVFTYFKTEKFFEKTHELGIKWFSIGITPDENKKYREGLILYRKDELYQKKILQLYAGTLKYSHENQRLFEKKLHLNDKLYSNEKNEIYLYYQSRLE